MTTLTIWQFPSVDGAPKAERQLATLSAQDHLPVNDASLVLWPEAAAAPHTRGAGNIAQLAPLDQYFWGLLYGHVFAAPLLGEGHSEPGFLREVGVDNELARVLRTGVVRGTSALLAITDHEIPAELMALVAGGANQAKIDSSRLTTEHAANLHRVFGR